MKKKRNMATSKEDGSTNATTSTKKKILPAAATFSSDDLAGIEGEILKAWTSRRESTASMKSIPLPLLPVEGGSFPTINAGAVGVVPIV
jgi:hypothetical protein